MTLVHSDLLIVGDVRRQKKGPRQASQLYEGLLFDQVRYATGTTAFKGGALQIHVLTAKYGLIQHDESIEPYDIVRGWETVLARPDLHNEYAVQLLDAMGRRCRRVFLCLDWRPWAALASHGGLTKRLDLLRSTQRLDMPTGGYFSKVQRLRDWLPY